MGGASDPPPVVAPVVSPVESVAVPLDEPASVLVSAVEALESLDPIELDPVDASPLASLSLPTLVVGPVAASPSSPDSPQAIHNTTHTIPKVDPRRCIHEVYRVARLHPSGPAAANTRLGSTEHLEAESVEPSHGT